MNKILVFTATYNEVDNIASLLEAIFAALPACEVLVVDDSSPDKTGELLEQIRARESRLHVIHRPGKNGLGTAHKLAVKYALAEGYDALITMDADFSHDPSYLPEMVRQLEQAEFVIGSRYVAGGSCEYPLSRVILSRVANSLTRAILSVPVHETTTSYRGFRRSLLERMNIDAIHADGYSYFVESIYQVSRLAKQDGARGGMAEFPIRFVDRRAGTTKILEEGDLERLLDAVSAGCPAGSLLGQSAPRSTRPRAAPLRAPRPLQCLRFDLPGPRISGVEPPGTPSQPTAARARAMNHTAASCSASPAASSTPIRSSHRRTWLSFYSKVEDTTYLENIDARIATFKYNLDAIAPLLPPGGRMLEVGSYIGMFLKIARERGFDVLGVEPSVWASSYAREKLQVPTITGSAESIPAGTKPFDVVCSWDVLEHVADPMAQLSESTSGWSRRNLRLLHPRLSELVSAAHGRDAGPG